MDYLVFQLQGMMASWGEAAVGEYRGSHDYPSSSALAGIVASALGIRREQETELQALHTGYLFGTGIYQSGELLTDYQTVQVPGRSVMKGHRHRTRKDELNRVNADLNTTLSTRDYRQSVDILVGVQTSMDAVFTLEEICQALKRPTFVLYLGRKSCPPCAPLNPHVLQADTLLAAFEAYRAGVELVSVPTLSKIAWPAGMSSGVAADLSVVRKDRLLHRGAWQFGDRIEHVAFFSHQGV